MKKIVLIFILSILILSPTYAKHQYEEYSFSAFWNYIVTGSDNYYQFQSDLIQDKDVIELAVPGLRYIGFLQIIDAFCFTLWFALTGAGDTKVLAVADILNHWLLCEMVRVHRVVDSTMSL